MKCKRHILIYVYIRTHFQEMIRVAHTVSSAGQYQPLVWFKSTYEGHEEDIRYCRLKGYDVIEPNDVFLYYRDYPDFDSLKECKLKDKQKVPKRKPIIDRLFAMLANRIQKMDESSVQAFVDVGKRLQAGMDFVAGLQNRIIEKLRYGRKNKRWLYGRMLQSMRERASVIWPMPHKRERNVRQPVMMRFTKRTIKRSVKWSFYTVFSLVISTLGPLFELSFQAFYWVIYSLYWLLTMPLVGFLNLASRVTKTTLDYSSRGYTDISEPLKASWQKAKHRLLSRLGKGLIRHKDKLDRHSKVLGWFARQTPTYTRWMSELVFASIKKHYEANWYQDRYRLPPTTQFIHVNFYAMPYLFLKFDIALIVIPEDNTFYLTPLLIYHAHERHIPVVIVPFTIVNIKEWAESFYSQRSSYVDCPTNIVMASLFPHWVIEHKQTRMILPAEYIIAFEKIGVTSPEPWLINSGYADALAAESPYMKRYYIKAGIQSKQIRMIGALYDDALYSGYKNADQKRQQLYCEHGLAHGKPMLLCAFPPNQLGSERKECDFSKYEALARFWVETLIQAADRYHLVFNLHPRTKPEELAFFADYPITISVWNIADLVPLADIYVACCSATIRMAISCGVPVVNYDVYRYRYDDYAGAAGVITLEEQEEFKETIDKLVLDEEYFAQIKGLQQTIKKEWAYMDGQCGARLLKLFDRLIEAKNKIVRLEDKKNSSRKKPTKGIRHKKRVAKRKKHA